MFVSTVNAAASVYNLLTASGESVDLLLAKAIELADQINTTYDEALTELTVELRKVHEAWGTSKFVIPAPPGGDEIDTESFHHASSL